MLEINFINKTRLPIQNYQNQAFTLLGNGLEILGVRSQKVSLSIHFIGKREALRLNEKYRHKNYTPDVLSFPTLMRPNEIQALGFHEIGDLFICLAEAKRKSNQHHHPLEVEIAFLLVHGFLHLWGFDHETGSKEEEKMFALQDQILASGGYEYLMLKS